MIHRGANWVCMKFDFKLYSNWSCIGKEKVNQLLGLNQIPRLLKLGIPTPHQILLRESCHCPPKSIMSRRLPLHFVFRKSQTCNALKLGAILTFTPHPFLWLQATTSLVVGDSSPHVSFCWPGATSIVLFSTTSKKASSAFISRFSSSLFMISNGYSKHIRTIVKSVPRHSRCFPEPFPFLLALSIMHGHQISNIA